MASHESSAEDVLDLLSIDQDELLELFDRYDALVADGAAPGRRRELAEEICSLLAVHVELKRDILHPAAREALADEGPIDESAEAGAGLDATIEDIQSGDPTEPGYDAAVRVLQELFVEGVDEERTTLFPRLRESSLDLVELGSRLAARAEELLSADEDDEPS
jgi:hypothetical protein